MQQHGGMVHHGHPCSQGPPQQHHCCSQPPPNWSSTAQFVNRAKQNALEQSGNHQLAALFNNNNGGHPQGGNGGSHVPNGFMASPMQGAHMGMAPQQYPPPGNGGCQCGNCVGGGNNNNNRGFNAAPQNYMGDNQMSPNGNGAPVMTFTSQLTNLPIPEHPSGLFPSVDFVMVPANGNSGCSCECGGGNSGGGMNSYMGGGGMGVQQSGQPMSRPQQPNYGWTGTIDNRSGGGCNGMCCGGGNNGMMGNTVQMNSLF